MAVDPNEITGWILGCRNVGLLRSLKLTINQQIELCGEPADVAPPQPLRNPKVVEAEKRRDEKRAAEKLELVIREKKAATETETDLEPAPPYVETLAVPSSSPVEATPAETSSDPTPSADGPQ